MPWQYGRLSSLVYQLDKPIGTSFGDVEFYLARLSGVTGEVLEPAVGTGRLLIPLLEQGLRVRGYDTSADMLAVCRANCAARGLDPVLFEADMVTFSDPGAFAAVAIPAGSFALVTGRDRAAAALRNIRESLAPPGRLIVDVEPPQLSPGLDPHRHWWHGDELVTLTAGHTEVDAVTQRTTTWGRYELWRDGELIRTELEPFTLQWYGLGEFSAMLRDAGFGQVTVHADYQAGQDPAAGSRVWTFEATAG
jgi:SAM-dependent methyltransferase